MKVTFPALWGRDLQLIDVQNLFCEIDKYARAAYPQFTGLEGRSRIKQRFQPAAAMLPLWYPPKWGINDKQRVVPCCDPEMKPPLGLVAIQAA